MNTFRIADRLVIAYLECVRLSPLICFSGDSMEGEQVEIRALQYGISLPGYADSIEASSGGNDVQRKAGR